jgi:tetratricopeptide (TPR) repeat protein
MPPKPPKPSGARSKPIAFLTMVFVAVNLAVGLVFLLRPIKEKPLPTRKPAVVSEGVTPPEARAYAGSAACKDCHAQAYEQWKGSHHALAERRVDRINDQPSFQPPRTFKHGTQTTDTRVAGDGRFEIVTMSASGERQVFLPERVLGESPLRQFLVPAPGGRMQVTEVAYDPRSNNWFNVYGDEDRVAGEWGHWTGRGMNWNMMCAYCHNTGVDKGYNPADDSYATRLVEMGVGCESCHGPMADHVQWQRPRPQPATGDPTVRKLTRDQMRDTCAVCHARRSELTGAFRPGEPFFDHHGLVIPDETDVYYPDGQVRDEDYEFAAFLGSRMHFSGVRCMDCHHGHTAKVRMEKDAMCMSCHAGPVAPAPKIDAATHSFHKRGTPGDHCVDCHMPMTVYMARHWRRDHGFTIPDPLLTKEHGIPNACNRCHADKTPDWSIKYVDEWYGQKMQRASRERARVVAQARTGQPAAVEGLIRITRDEPIPYWRAVATLMLRRWADQPRVIEAVSRRASDTNALVRAMSARALDNAMAGSPRPEVATALNLMREDPVRLVRADAAWSLRRGLDTNSAAGQDLLRAMRVNSDQPQGLMHLAVWHMDRGDNSNALALLQKAVTWDRYSAPLFSALAVCLSVEGRREEAVTALQTACKLAPREAEYHFRLALSLNELNRLNDTVASLKEAVKLDPSFSRAWYNLGLAYSEQVQPELALEALLKAEALEPRSPQPPYARATVLARLGRVVEARAAAQKALTLDPGFADAARLLQQLPPR